LSLFESHGIKRRKIGVGSRKQRITLKQLQSQTKADKVEVQIHLLFSKW
jgi:hypothetical protein